ncbi:MAG: pseudouridine synthase [Limnohabitans sp.]|jgi:tRNA pseudouridine32 synthase/23S rRNA pseudouridine746 synthase|nr:pseudouridine synthase [Limnohabitans sp.]
MARPPKADLPLRAGVSPSCVALPAGPWVSVLEFLVQRLPALSEAQWRDRFARGLVLDAQGKALSEAAAYARGTKVYYYREVDHEPTLPFAPQVVFEDEHLLVADKPHFMPVLPTGRYVQQSLLVQMKRLSGCASLSPIHRIDRETAGLVVFAKQPQERDAYQRLVREQALDKLYLGVSAWAGERVPAVYRSQLAEDPERFFVMREASGPPNSETRLRLLRVQDGRALLALKPVSGRKHQLRVHLLALGLPLLGDRFYPEVREGPDAPADFADPLQLLAKRLRFRDPITGRWRRFESPSALALAPAHAHGALAQAR